MGNLIARLFGKAENTELDGEGIKKYSGKYHDGKATYSYREKGEERIFIGKFSYEHKFATSHGKGYNRVKGSFDDKGRKQGVWTFEHRSGDSLKFLEVEYRGGVHEGVYHYSASEPVFDRFTEQTGLQFTMRNGAPVGSFQAVLLGGTLSGECDDDGRPVGTWTYEKTERNGTKRVHVERWEKGELLESYSANASGSKKTEEAESIRNLIDSAVSYGPLELERIVHRGSNVWHGDIHRSGRAQ
ncbi:MAG: hypothetical protein IJ710_11000 [Prevotella sp.]|nr:hypothetical protein [Prevotella sp.]